MKSLKQILIYSSSWKWPPEENYLTTLLNERNYVKRLRHVSTLRLLMESNTWVNWKLLIEISNLKTCFSITQIISRSWTSVFRTHGKITKLWKQPAEVHVMLLRRWLLENDTTVLKPTSGHQASYYMRWSVDSYHLKTRILLLFIRKFWKVCMRLLNVYQLIVRSSWALFSTQILNNEQLLRK